MSEGNGMDGGPPDRCRIVLVGVVTDGWGECVAVSAKEAGQQPACGRVASTGRRWSLDSPSWSAVDPGALARGRQLETSMAGHRRPTENWESTINTATADGGTGLIDVKSWRDVDC